jgi:hypothetical protein
MKHISEMSSAFFEEVMPHFPKNMLDILQHDFPRSQFFREMVASSVIKRGWEDPGGLAA